MWEAQVGAGEGGSSGRAQNSSNLPHQKKQGIEKHEQASATHACNPGYLGD
jgi:hypothetical protein